jgi:hypothetical protein
VHGAVDVLEPLLTQIGKLDANLASDVIVSERRDADASGFCDAFKPRRNIHAIAKDIMGLYNYVTDIDAHTEGDAPVLDIAVSQVVDARLELHSSSKRFDCARKFRQEPIASVFDDAAAMFTNCRGDSVGQEHCQFGVRSLFIIVHEARVASHVGGQYRRQPALYPDWPLLHHG